MGINWTDLGNIAKGAIERDKEITRAMARSNCWF